MSIDKKPESLQHLRSSQGKVINTPSEQRFLSMKYLNELDRMIAKEQKSLEMLKDVPKVESNKPSRNEQKKPDELKSNSLMRVQAVYV